MEVAGEIASVGAVVTRFSVDDEVFAQTVLDYTREDFTRLPATYDVLIDAIGKCSFIRALRKLRPGGPYLLANPGLGQMIAAPAIGLASRRKVIHGPSKELTENLEYLGGLVDSDTLRTVIYRTYPLEQDAEAHGYVDAGEKTGNGVIDIGD